MRSWLSVARSCSSEWIAAHLAGTYHFSADDRAVHAFVAGHGWPEDYAVQSGSRFRPFRFLVVSFTREDNNNDLILLYRVLK